MPFSVNPPLMNLKPSIPCVLRVIYGFRGENFQSPLYPRVLIGCLNPRLCLLMPLRQLLTLLRLLIFSTVLIVNILSPRLSPFVIIKFTPLPWMVKLLLRMIGKLIPLLSINPLDNLGLEKHYVNNLRVIGPYLNILLPVLYYMFLFRLFRMLMPGQAGVLLFAVLSI